MDKHERIQLFTETIWNWYSIHKRELPWRDLKDSDPTARAYKILVSEVMLQQTQVSRVKIVFRDFLEKFPKISDLGSASNRDVLLAWRGMGYNSRALRLRDAAKAIVEQFEKKFPESMEDLLAIKGIGSYTAAAIRNFAFNIPTPCIDTNIRRILHRTFVGPENADGTWKKDDQFLLSLAREVLDTAISPPPSEEGLGVEWKTRDAANWHASLMDFGSLVQTKNNPRWDVCPLTARGIMKTTKRTFDRRRGLARQAPTTQIEPGRFVGQKYIPNRIFRGKIVEALRDAERGLTVTQIGREVCIDWNAKEHDLWLKNLIKKLVQDGLLQHQRNKFGLSIPRN